MMLFERNPGITSDPIRIRCERLQEGSYFNTYFFVPRYTPSPVLSCVHPNDPAGWKLHFRNSLVANSENTAGAD